MSGMRRLVNSAVEEILRWTTAVIYFMRTASEDVVLGGTAVSAGDPIVMIYASANRDPSRFAGPGSFDISREDNQHVAFGHGIHYCLGAPLARLEGQIAIGSVLRRLPEVRLAVDGGELSFLYTVTVFGSPRDVTLDEIAVETFFPADDATREALAALAGRWVPAGQAPT